MPCVTINGENVKIIGYFIVLLWSGRKFSHILYTVYHLISQDKIRRKQLTTIENGTNSYGVNSYAQIQFIHAHCMF